MLVLISFYWFTEVAMTEIDIWFLLVSKFHVDVFKNISKKSKLTIDCQFEILAHCWRNIIFCNAQICAHILPGDLLQLQNFSMDSFLMYLLAFSVMESYFGFIFWRFWHLLPNNGGMWVSSCRANEFCRASLSHTEVFGAMFVRYLGWDYHFKGCHLRKTFNFMKIAKLKALKVIKSQYTHFENLSK